MRRGDGVGGCVIQLIDSLSPPDVFVVQFDPRPDVVDIVDGKLKLYVCAAVSINRNGRSSVAVGLFAEKFIFLSIITIHFYAGKMLLKKILLELGFC